MYVIAEDCERHDLNCENPRENFESISNPVFPMREISANIFINAAQNCASHTAIDQMKDLYFIVCKDLTPIASWQCNCPYPKTTNPFRPNNVDDPVSFVKVTGTLMPNQLLAIKWFSRVSIETGIEACPGTPSSVVLSTRLHDLSGATVKSAAALPTRLCR